MGTLGDVISEIEARKQQEREQEHAMRRLEAERARLPGMRDEEAISVAAMKEYEEAVAELHKIGDVFAALYQDAIDRKSALLDIVKEMGELVNASARHASKAENAKKHIRSGESLIVPRISHGFNDVIMLDPTPYIGRSQFMAAFNGQDWHSETPYNRGR